MKKLILLLLSLLPMALPASDYMKYMQWADDAVAKEKWADAVAYLIEAMRSEPANPHNPMLLSNVGMLQYYQGLDSLAIKTLSEARAMAPGSKVILANRAKVLNSAGRFDDAFEDCSLILSMDSTYTDALALRAGILLRRGDTDAAAADIARFRTLRPADSQGTLLQALLLSNTGHPAEAIPLYTELIDADESSAYLAARALCRLATADLAGASSDIGRGLELDPQNGELYYCRAYLNHLRFLDRDRDADTAAAIRLGVAPSRLNAIPLIAR